MSDQHPTSNESTSESTIGLSNEPVSVRQPSVMLSDLTGDLLWPRILRAPALALAPSRVWIGFVCAYLITLILTIAQQFGEGVEQQLEAIGGQFSIALTVISDGMLSGSPLGVVSGVGYAAVVLRDIAMESPIVSLLVGIPIIATLSVAGGAIARSSAMEFTKGRFVSNGTAVGFAFRRIGQFVGVVVGPIIFCVLIFLLIAIGGILMSVPVLDVVGALIYGIGLVLGIVASVVLMLHVLALPMIVPALAVEGTDAFDAVQRSYAYVIGKPLRYILYVLILAVLGVVSIQIVQFVAMGSMSMTDWAAQFFSNDATARVLIDGEELGATQGIAYSIVRFWKAVINLAVAGYAISMFFTGSTLLYLVLRRICDGQDVNEIWDGVGE